MGLFKKAWEKEDKWSKLGLNEQLNAIKTATGDNQYIEIFNTPLTHVVAKEYLVGVISDQAFLEKVLSGAGDSNVRSLAAMKITNPSALLNILKNDKDNRVVLHTYMRLALLDLSEDTLAQISEIGPAMDANQIVLKKALLSNKEKLKNLILAESNCEFDDLRGNVLGQLLLWKFES